MTTAAFFVISGDGSAYRFDATQPNGMGRPVGKWGTQPLGERHCVVLRDGPMRYVAILDWPPPAKGERQIILAKTDAGTAPTRTTAPP